MWLLRWLYSKNFLRWYVKMVVVKCVLNDIWKRANWTWFSSAGHLLWLNKKLRDKKRLKCENDECHRFVCRRLKIDCQPMCKYTACIVIHIYLEVFSHVYIFMQTRIDKCIEFEALSIQNLWTLAGKIDVIFRCRSFTSSLVSVSFFFFSHTSSDAYMMLKTYI